MRASPVFAVRTSPGTLPQDMERLLGFLEPKKGVRTICIKPNMNNYRRPESGSAPDPRVLAPLLRVLQKIYPGASISIVENNASGTDAGALFRILGLDRLAGSLGASVVNLADEEWVEKEIPGRHYRKLLVPRILEEADLIVNHPKLKTHIGTKITCGLKNMFGCYREKYKVNLHPFLDDAIVDINLAVRSDWTVVDGVIAMEGEGPCWGIPRQLGVLVAGPNVVSVDAFCARLAGFRPRSISHLRKAHHAGLGHLRYTLHGDIAPRQLRAYHLRYDRLRHFASGIAHLE